MTVAYHPRAGVWAVQVRNLIFAFKKTQPDARMRRFLNVYWDATVFVPVDDVPAAIPRLGGLVGRQREME